MKAALSSTLLAAGLLAAIGGACNELSGVNDLAIVSGSDAKTDDGPGSASFDGPGSEAGNAEAAGDSDARDGATSGFDAPDDLSMDAQTSDAEVEGAADAVTESGLDGDASIDADAPTEGAADVVATPADAADATTDASDASDATSTIQDATVDAPASDAGCAVATPVCDAGCPTAHSDGFGHTFYDCAPWGTLNETQALEACTAYTGSATQCANDPIGCANADEVCTTGTSTCVCWTYTGMHSGKVFASTTTTCTCYVASAPSWN